MALAAVVLAGCRPPGPAVDVISLRAGYTSAVDIGDLPSLIAHRVLSGQGIAVEATFFAQPELAVDALAGGDVDIASGGVRAFWAANARGADLVMLMEHSENGYVIVATPTIERCADFDGRTLALSSRGSLPAALGERFLLQCPAAHAALLVMPHSGDRLAALAGHAVDAAILQRADLVRLQRRAPGQFHVVEGAGDALPPLDLEGVFTSRRFLREHRDRVVAYVRERLRANRRVLDDPATLFLEAAFWPALGALDETVVAGELAAPAWTRDGGITADSLAATLKFFVESGTLPPNLDAGRLADLTVLRDALDELGTDDSGSPNTPPREAR